MGFQEELDALAQQYQGQPRDPQIDQIYNYVNQSQAPQGSNLPEWLAPLMQSMSGAVGPSAGILSQFTQQPDEYQNQPLSEVYPKSGLMGVGGEMMNRLQANTDPISQLTDYLMSQGKEVMFGQGEQSQAQGPQQSFPQLPQQEPTLREADPIAQISAMLAAQGQPVVGDAQVVNSRGSFSRSNPISDSIQNANREAARELATRQAGQGSPLTDEERQGRKLEDVLIGTPRDPGLMGGIASQDQEVMTQLVNSVREINGLGPVEAQAVVDEAVSSAGGDLLKAGLVLGGTYLGAKYGGKIVNKALGRDLPKMKTSAGSFPKGPRTGTKKAPSGDDLVAKMRGNKVKPETGSFKTGSDNKAGGYQGTREVGAPERGFQMKGGSSSKAPDGRAVRAEVQKANAPKQKGLPDNSPKERLRLETGETFPITKAERGFILGKGKLSTTEKAELKKKFIQEIEQRSKSQKGLPAPEAKKLIGLDPESLRKMEIEDLRDMFKGVFKQKK